MCLIAALVGMGSLVGGGIHVAESGTITTACMASWTCEPDRKLPGPRNLLCLRALLYPL